MKLVTKVISVIVFSIFCHSAFAEEVSTYVYAYGGGGSDTESKTVSIPEGKYVLVETNVYAYDHEGRCSAFAQVVVNGSEYKTLTAYNERTSHLDAFNIVSPGSITIEATVDRDTSCNSRAYATVKLTWSE